MPIINIQRRMAEQGRIRLGQRVTTASGKTRPDKLDRFRFTSPNQRLIDDVAQLYGGTPRPWDNDGKAEFEVITDARSIPVIVVKGGFSQWYEAWTKAGCKHRCDGEKDVTGAPCDLNDPLHVEATEKPTTRLSVMLSQVESLGVWRMETKGWNAAAELPSMAELAMHVGDLVPATLSLAERSAVITGKDGKPQTSRFVVPVLDLHVSKRRLIELVGGTAAAPALEQGPATATRPALEAAPAREVEHVDVAGRVATCKTREQLAKEYEWVKTLSPDAVGLTWDEVRDLFAEQGRRVDVTQEPAADVQDTETVPDTASAALDEDALWMAVVSAAGDLGWSTDRMEQAYSEWTQGELLDDANAGRLAEFRDWLRKQPRTEQVTA